MNKIIFNSNFAKIIVIVRSGWVKLKIEKNVLLPARAAGVANFASNIWFQCKCIQHRIGGLSTPPLISYIIIHNAKLQTISRSNCHGTVVPLASWNTFLKQWEGDGWFVRNRVEQDSIRRTSLWFLQRLKNNNHDWLLRILQKEVSIYIVFTKI